MDAKKPHPSEHSEQGQSLVEFGVSVVILLILVSGVIDLGRAFFTLITLHDAVQEGVTYAQICPADTSGIRARLQESASDPVDLADLQVGDISICITSPGSDVCGASVSRGNEVTVGAHYDHVLTTPFIGTLVGSQTIELRADAREKILRTDCSTQ